MTEYGSFILYKSLSRAFEVGDFCIVVLSCVVLFCCCCCVVLLCVVVVVGIVAIVVVLCCVLMLRSCVVLFVVMCKNLVPILTLTKNINYHPKSDALFSLTQHFHLQI